MMTASLALKPSTSLTACRISDGLRRTAFARWCRVLTVLDVFAATGPAVVVPDVGCCGVIGVVPSGSGLESVQVGFRRGSTVSYGCNRPIASPAPGLRGRVTDCHRDETACHRGHVGCARSLAGAPLL